MMCGIKTGAFWLGRNLCTMTGICIRTQTERLLKMRMSPCQCLHSAALQPSWPLATNSAHSTVLLQPTPASCPQTALRARTACVRCPCAAATPPPRLLCCSPTPHAPASRQPATPLCVLARCSRLVRLSTPGCLPGPGRVHLRLHIGPAPC